MMESGLGTDRSRLIGKFTVSCVQFMLIAGLIWLLLIYDISMCTMEVLERKIDTALRKWLGVPQSLSNVALYCKKAKLIVYGKAHLSVMPSEYNNATFRKPYWGSKREGNVKKQCCQLCSVDVEVRGHGAYPDLRARIWQNFSLVVAMGRGLANSLTWDDILKMAPSGWVSQWARRIVSYHQEPIWRHVKGK